jgi:hypothetical protein
LKESIVHYKVIAITGEIVATAKSKSEAEQMAKIHCLSVDRVFEASDQEGWIGLGIGLSVMLFWLVWLVLQFSSEQLKLDWPALLASPGPTLFFIFVLPIVGAIQIAKGFKRVLESRRAARGQQRA